MKPLSIQLYTVRELTKDGGHIDVLKKIADIGYKGVEGSGFGMTPTEFRKFVGDLGMVVSSYFGPFPDAEHANEFIETAQALGVTETVSGFWIEDFASVDAIKKTADKVREASERLKAVGLTLCLHNHWMEFEQVEGKLAVEHLIEFFPEVKLELDIYWCSAFGANDAVKMVEQHAGRMPLMHVKDGPLVRGEPQVAVGQGTVDIKSAIHAADPSVLKWLIVELDECATDMLKAVEESYRYLVGNGLALGNKPVE